MRGPARRLPLASLALLLAAGVVAGSAATVAGYWLLHHGGREDVAARSYLVELAPSEPGRYEAYVPVPVEKDGGVARGLALRAVEGEPEFLLVGTRHGPALRVKAEGPVVLLAEGALPLRFSLDDERFRFRQFKFWSFLGPGAAGAVLAKVEVRERRHTEDWEQHLDVGRSIVVQEALEPEGWQVLPATHYFDVALEGGTGAGFPRLALAALTVALGSLYLPLGAAVLRAGARDAFK